MSRLRLCKGSEWRCTKGHNLFPEGPCLDETPWSTQEEKHDPAHCANCRHFQTKIYVP